MVKFGVRKPSWKKSLSARTKGQFTRSVKRKFIPGYGKRGIGWLHPRRKLYSSVYRRSTVSVNDLFKKKRTSTRRKASTVKSNGFHLGCGGLFVLALILTFAIQFWPIVLLVAVAICLAWYLNTRKAKKNAAAKAEADKEHADKAAEQISEDEAIRRLREYKGLLDQGAITQDEYDAKKKQLLNLNKNSDSWQDF